MEAVKERRDKCPKMIIYVNSITMCEMLYIWFHSELKKDEYIDEMTIKNRMVELYHAHTDEDTKLPRHIYSNTLGITTFSAHTDEDTKLSRHIYSNTLGITTFSTTNVARDW